jgi:Tetratricopeptide repeat
MGRVVAAITFACSMLSVPAQAGEGDKAVARAHYETATRLYEVREYADALKEYKAAYVAKPDAAFLFNIGQCYRKMDKNAEALDFFQQFLKKSPSDDPNREQVEARIRNIQAGLNSNYDPFDKSAAVQAQPPAAQAGPTPVPEPILPSVPVQVLTTKPGLPAQQSPPQPLVTPLVESQPPAMVTTPIRRQPAGMAATRSTTSENSVEGNDGWWLSRKWTWVAASSAVVFSAGAVSAGLAMQSKFDSLRSSCGIASAKQQGCTQSDLTALDTRKNAANVMWGLAGVAVAAAGVLFYLEGRPVTVAPLAGGTTGLLASVRY